MRTLLSLALASVLLAACGQSAGLTEPSAAGLTPPDSAEMQRAVTTRAIDVATLQRDLEAGAVPVLVDVRTSGEYASGHVAGAIHVPLDEIGERLGELEAYRDAELYLICRSGNRSAQAQRLLEQAGFSTVNVEGGTAAWMASGLPVE